MEAPDNARRQFFKQSVWSMGKAVYEYYEQQKETEKTPETVPEKFRTDWLRPPGAVEEALFLERCTRCGDCLPACPFGSIKKDPANGYPVLFANESPCFLCDDFPCVAACATEALVPLGERAEVRMGLAVVNEATCTADQGCRFCSFDHIVWLDSPLTQSTGIATFEQCAFSHVCLPEWLLT